MGSVWGFPSHDSGPHWTQKSVITGPPFVAKGHHRLHPGDAAGIFGRHDHAKHQPPNPTELRLALCGRATPSSKPGRRNARMSPIAIPAISSRFKAYRAGGRCSSVGANREADAKFAFAAGDRISHTA